MFSLPLNREIALIKWMKIYGVFRRVPQRLCMRSHLVLGYAHECHRANTQRRGDALLNGVIGGDRMTCGIVLVAPH